MASMIVTNDLVKRYADTVALDHVDLSVDAGSVYGLIGPNGAGKTTLLGILSGLRGETSGSVQIDSDHFAVLPDSPAFDPWMTAYEVVDLARTLAPTGVAESAVMEVLEQAGLAGAAKRRVSGFSRGMFQRLGIAATVVGEPEVLLLDEPAAALDPQGRREVLDLVANLRGRATVLFSSHILDDVEEVCDEIGILRRGELVFEGSLQGLIARQTPHPVYTVVVRGDGSSVADGLRRADWVAEATADGSTVTVTADSSGAIEAGLVGELAAMAVPVISMGPHIPSLEEIFLQVTA
jgi:ABC-2 type transport system ATP-binding protein